MNALEDRRARIRRGVDVDDARAHRLETRVSTGDAFFASFARFRDETSARGGVTAMGVSRGGSGRRAPNPLSSKTPSGERERREGREAGGETGFTALSVRTRCEW